MEKKTGLEFDPTEAPSFTKEPIAALEKAKVKLQGAIDFNAAIGELKKLEVKLPIDPVKSGLNELHRLLAAVQDYQDICAKHLRSAIWLRGKWEQLSANVELLYSQRSARVLMEMPSIQSLRNATLQQAGVSTILSTEKSLLDSCTSNLEEVKAFHDICRITFENLQETNKNLSRQIKVIDIQVEIGEVPRVGRARSNADDL